MTGSAHNEVLYPTPETALLQLSKGREVLVDRRELPRLLSAGRKWLCQIAGGIPYAARAMTKPDGSTTLELMHRFLMGADLGDPRTVCHSNGNSLDCRLANLRFDTTRRNQQERVCHQRGKLPGCSYRKDSGRWRTRIWVGEASEWVSLGSHATELQAHAVYLIALDHLGLNRPRILDSQRPKLLGLQEALGRVDREHIKHTLNKATKQHGKTYPNHDRPIAPLHLRPRVPRLLG